MTTRDHSRRDFLKYSTLSGAGVGIGAFGNVKAAAAAVTSEAARPSTAWGLQFGDVGSESAVVWTRTDRPARMLVEWSTDERFRRSQRVRGPGMIDTSDYTGRFMLRGLPAGADIYVKVELESLVDKRVRSAPLLGRFRTAPRQGRDVRFLWTGDTAGQGWGIDLGFGGMKAYETMRQTNPDFFIHSGDNIYADGVMVPEVKDAAGNVIWRNAFLDVVPEKLKVAETLLEFRRNYLYNRYDANVRAFSAEVAQIWQWDDHETMNNWSPSKQIDARYTETDISVIVPRARQAFLEYSPMSWGRGDSVGRIYRHVPYGPDLDVFVLDMRSYRAGNGCNVEPTPGPETAYLGQEQLDWLKRQLRASRATWKIIASDMPLGIVVGDGTDASGCPRFENSSNGDGPVLGREFEIADILSFIKRHHIDGTVWLTADVHYCAANYYDNTVAQYQDFDPFWEFVAGPIHAGTFGPNAMDNTFGPTVIFEKTPPAGQANLPPSAGLQFFGQVDLDARTKRLLVSLKDSSGATLFSQELTPGMRW